MIDHDEIPEREAPADPWSALLPGQELVPAYLISRFAGRYRVIVDVLLAEQVTSLTGLSHDESPPEIVLAHRTGASGHGRPSARSRGPAP